MSSSTITQENLQTITPVMLQCNIFNRMWMLMHWLGLNTLFIEGRQIWDFKANFTVINSLVIGLIIATLVLTGFLLRNLFNSYIILFWQKYWNLVTISHCILASIHNLGVPWQVMFASPVYPQTMCYCWTGKTLV